MPYPKILLFAALLLLLCACGPPTSSDPAAMDTKYVMYEPDEEYLTEARTEIQEKVIVLRERLREMPTDFPDYDSVASGKTEKTEQRAGGTERMQNLPERGTNVGQELADTVAYNRDLLDGLDTIDAEAENLAVEANSRVNAARAALSVAHAQNKLTQEEVNTLEEPLLAVEAALSELMNARKALDDEMNSNE